MEVEKEDVTSGESVLPICPCLCLLKTPSSPPTVEPPTTIKLDFGLGGGEPMVDGIVPPSTYDQFHFSGAVLAWIFIPVFCITACVCGCRCNYSVLPFPFLYLYVNIIFYPSLFLGFFKRSASRRQLLPIRMEPLLDAEALDDAAAGSVDN